ncbi:MAG: hypothetical protein KDA69_14055 [Planctomycetaceae bacterium]|nr:hypothetical protein [Planctomycetaceae bacterium]MCA9045446.1 hypothetical protein [Planctomycetaceae bacterium]
MVVDYISVLDSWLPDGKILADVVRIIQGDSGGILDLDSGPVSIPTSTNYEVISKALIKQPATVGFGSCFRAVIAIGGLLEPASGILKARYAFATFWYSMSGDLITTDFETDTPV